MWRLGSWMEWKEWLKQAPIFGKSHLLEALKARREQSEMLEVLVRKAAEACGYEGDWGYNYRDLAHWFDLVSAKPDEEWKVPWH